MVRIDVRDPAGSRHREDPHALKVNRRSTDLAYEFVGNVNEEAARRGSRAVLEVVHGPTTA